MPSSKFTYDLSSGAPSPVVKEEHIEYGFIGKLQNLKYEYRDDIRDRAALEKNFREKFEALNRVKLTEAEFARLLDEIVTPDVYTAAKTLRSINAFTRDDGTPLNYTLVNIRDWCKNHFEVVRQLRINTDNSHHRYDVLTIVNTLSHKKVYYFESDELNADSLKTFERVFIGLKEKYQFVLHTPAPDAASPAAFEAVATA